MTSSMSRRVLIGPGSDGFLGGRPPDGVLPLRGENAFFASVPFSGPGCWLSIFVTSEFYDLATSLRLWKISNCPSTIECIVHSGPLRRSQGDSHRSLLSEHLLTILPATSDLVEGEAREGNKFGGMPAFLPGRTDASLAVSGCLADGFVHFAQFDIVSDPGRDELVTGSWPFGDRLISFFLRNLGQPEWRVFWRT